jgi:hypothetical protein
MHWETVGRNLTTKRDLTMAKLGCMKKNLKASAMKNSARSITNLHIW